MAYPKFRLPPLDVAELLAEYLPYYGPMPGVDNAKLDETFFSGTSWKSNCNCTLGDGDSSHLWPRQPRLKFEEACRID